MLCNSEANQSFKIPHIVYFILFLLHTSVQLSPALFIPDQDYNVTATMLTNNVTNDTTGDDLYVIKAVVYEIGILTDTNNTANDTTERQEEVKLSFYNPPNKNDP